MYVLSLYWGLATLTSTGYGDIHAVSIGEQWYSAACMLMGVALFGYLMGSLTSTLTNKEALRARFEQDFQALSGHMHRERLPSRLQARVRRYLQHLWSKKRGRVEEDLFGRLPLTMQSEVALSSASEMIVRVPSFATCEASFLRMAALALKPTLFQPQEEILSFGNVIPAMYFIVSGTVHITDREGLVRRKLHQGDHFCEVGMVLQLRSTVCYTAASSCELYVLERAGLDGILEHYPSLRNSIIAEVSSRLLGASAAHDVSKRQTGGLGVVSAKSNTVVPMLAEDKNEEPCSKTSLVATWRERIVVVCSLISVVLVFFQSAFAPDNTWLWIAGYCLDAIAWADIGRQICHRRRIYPIHFGAGENDQPMKIARASERKALHILGTDILAHFPIALLFWGLPRISMTARSLLRANRVLGIHHTWNWFAGSWARLASYPRYDEPLALFVHLLVALHTAACLWSVMATADACGFTLAPSAKDCHRSNVDGVIGAYIEALYWAVATATSTGYGDVVPTTFSRRLFAGVVMVIGQLLFGLLLAIIAAILANSESPKVNYYERLRSMQQFLLDHNVSPVNSQRLTRHMKCRWSRDQGHDLADVSARLAPSLRGELSHEATGKALEKFPLLSGANTQLLRLICDCMRRILVLPGSNIVTMGDCGRAVYVIHRGIAEVVSHDGQRPVAMLTPGCYFGEVGFLFEQPRLSTVRAVTHCELFMLPWNTEFERACRLYPYFAQQVSGVAARTDLLQAIKRITMLTESGRPPASLLKEAQRRVSTFRPSVLTHTSLPRFSMVHSPRVSPETLDPGVGDTAPPPHSPRGFWVQWGLWLLAKLTMPRVLMPESKFARAWEKVMVAIALLGAVLAPLQAAFFPLSWELLVVGYCIDALFAVDFYLKLHTGYLNSQGMCVTKRTMTSYHYAKHNMPFDLLPLLPLDLLCLVARTPKGRLRLLGVLRLPRTLRIYRLFQMMNYQEQLMTRAASSLKTLKFAVLIPLVVHWVSCGWYLVTCFDGCHSDGAPSSWASLKNASRHHHPYVLSLYWSAATLTSTGYGDYHASTSPERAAALLVMLAGTLFFGYIMSSMAAALANADFQRSRFREKVESATWFLERYGVPADVVQRVVSFYQYKWQRNRGVDAKTLFDEVPATLQTDLSSEVYEDAILNVPLFRNKSSGFTRTLSTMMSPLMLLENEYIVRKGDPGEEMFFIHAGTVDVVSEDGKDVFASMHAGEFFGEISLIFSCPRTASIRTASKCDLFVLTRRDLDVVLRHFPDIAREIRNEAGERFEIVKKRAGRSSQTNGKAVAPSAASTASTASDSGDAAGGGPGDQCQDEPEGECGTRQGDQDPAETGDSCQAGKGKGSPPASLRSRISAAAQLFCGGFFFDASSRTSRWAEVVSITVISVSLISNTFESAFATSHYTPLWALNMSLEAYFLAEVWFRAHCTVPKADMDRRQCASLAWQRYRRHHLKWDLLVMVAVPVLAAASALQQRLPPATVLQLCAGFRCLRLLRLRRVIGFFRRREAELNARVVVLRLFKFFLVVVVACHSVSCTWAVLACQAGHCVAGSWAVHEGLAAGTASIFAKYSTSLYWAVATMTSTGYGDVVAHSEGEMLFACAVMIMSRLLFGYILGNIASTLAGAAYRQVLYKEAVQAGQEELRDRGVSCALQRAVYAYQHRWWAEVQGVQMQDILCEVPSTLRTEVLLLISHKSIQAVPLFATLDHGAIVALAVALRPQLFFAGNHLAFSGDIVHQMFFVHRGVVNVVDDSGETIGTHGAGSFFGSEALLSKRPNRFSYVAAETVDVLVLRREDAGQIVDRSTAA